MSNDEHLRKYLELQHLTINRIANNSFLIKGWTITLTTVIVGIMSTRDDLSYKVAFLVLIPIVIFALLDAYYLSIERKMKKRFAEVVDSFNEGRLNEIKMYQISTKQPSNISDTVWGALFSLSILLTYVPLILLVLFVLLLFCK